MTISRLCRLGSELPIDGIDRGDPGRLEKMGRRRDTVSSRARRRTAPFLRALQLSSLLYFGFATGCDRSAPERAGTEPPKREHSNWIGVLRDWPVDRWSSAFPEMEEIRAKGDGTAPASRLFTIADFRPLAADRAWFVEADGSRVFAAFLQGVDGDAGIATLQGELGEPVSRSVAFVGPRTVHSSSGFAEWRKPMKAVAIIDEPIERNLLAKILKKYPGSEGLDPSKGGVFVMGGFGEAAAKMVAGLRLSTVVMVPAQNPFIGDEFAVGNATGVVTSIDLRPNLPERPRKRAPKGKANVVVSLQVRHPADTGPGSGDDLVGVELRAPDGRVFRAVSHTNSVLGEVVQSGSSAAASVRKEEWVFQVPFDVVGSPGEPYTITVSDPSGSTANKTFQVFDSRLLDPADRTLELPELKKFTRSRMAELAEKIDTGSRTPAVSEQWSAEPIGASAAKQNGGTHAGAGKVFLTFKYTVTNHTDSTIHDPLLGLTAVDTRGTEYRNRNQTGHAKYEMPIDPRSSQPTWVTFEVPRRVLAGPVRFYLPGSSGAPQFEHRVKPSEILR